MPCIFSWCNGTMCMIWGGIFCYFWMNTKPNAFFLPQVPICHYLLQSCYNLTDRAKHKMQAWDGRTIPHTAVLRKLNPTKWCGFALVTRNRHSSECCTWTVLPSAVAAKCDSLFPILNAMLYIESGYRFLLLGCNVAAVHIKEYYRV